MFCFKTLKELLRRTQIKNYRDQIMRNPVQYLIDLNYRLEINVSKINDNLKKKKNPMLTSVSPLQYNVVNLETMNVRLSMPYNFVEQQQKQFQYIDNDISRERQTLQYETMLKNLDLSDNREVDFINEAIHNINSFKLSEQRFTHGHNDALPFP